MLHQLRDLGRELALMHGGIALPGKLPVAVGLVAQGLLREASLLVELRGVFPACLVCLLFARLASLSFFR